MSQFFDQASLVMVPSGYKDGKVYSQKPLSTDGELTFSRATSATRVGPDGLIEKVRTNLQQRSEQFEAWLNTNFTVTLNYTTAPNGTLTADRFISTSSTCYSYYNSGQTVGITYTISVWAKRNDAGTQIFGFFTNGSGGMDSPMALTNEWQRFSYTYTAINTSTWGLSASASGADVSVWGFQAEISDFGATDYIATTTAAVSVGPVSGLPRLDYLGSSCGKLLLEGQRTNLLTYSNYDASLWSQTNASVSINTAISPDGYQNAHTATRTSSSNVRVGVAVFTGTVGQPYTDSIYLRKVSGSGVVSIKDINNTPTEFTLTNEWQRYSLTASSAAATLRLYVDMNADGDVIEFWQGQIEQGSYATSIIPTLGSAVTRLADSASKTGISSLIGQTEGTIYWEGYIDVSRANYGYFPRLSMIGDGTSANFAGVLLTQVNQLTTRFIVSNVNQATITHNLTTSGTYKIAFAYKQNDFVLYVNGVNVGSDNSGNVVGLSRFYIGGEIGDGTTPPSHPTSQALLFPTRLTNAKLAELTTL